MTDLEWTDEPPEEPGSYLRRQLDIRGQPCKEKECEVFRDDHGALRTEIGGGTTPLVRLLHCEWAGPTPEPE